MAPIGRPRQPDLRSIRFGYFFSSFSSTAMASSFLAGPAAGPTAEEGLPQRVIVRDRDLRRWSYWRAIFRMSVNSSAVKSRTKTREP